jgi:hypothetical protein
MNDASFQELIDNERKFIETFLVVENKQRQRVPFIYNDIQADADASETGMDIWLKPSQVGFSTERIAKRLVNTLTHPGTNTVLVAYEDFITERLLSKVNFFYNHLDSLHIPGFPEVYHNSTYEKTYNFRVDGRIISTSSIYIASARSKTAGRAETIHHLLLDEHAFYVPEATERIIAPAMARIPPGGTVDSFSTPNGEENEFHQWYVDAKNGNSIFTAHAYPWFLHKEYTIPLGDPRIQQSIPETDKEEFHLEADEELLMFTHGLTFSQIRWRRWMQKVMASLRRKGEIRTLFPQEFLEDDVTCFLSTGEQWYSHEFIEAIAKTCYEAPWKMDGLNVWYRPERDEEGRPTKQYWVTIDPGQERITQSAISVMTFEHDELGNVVPIWCARDAGWYSPEVTWEKACKISDYYHRAEIAWEANAHGLAISVLGKNRRPIYFRKDIIQGTPTMTPGWLTTPSTKPYMMQQVTKYLPSLICHDIELVRQLRNFREVGGKLEIVGLDDIHDTLAIRLAIFNPTPVKRGYQGRTGYAQDWGKKRKIKHSRRMK